MMSVAYSCDALSDSHSEQGKIQNEVWMGAIKELSSIFCCRKKSKILGKIWRLSTGETPNGNICYWLYFVPIASDIGIILIILYLQIHYDLINYKFWKAKCIGLRKILSDPSHSLFWMSKYHFSTQKKLWYVLIWVIAR